MYCNLVLVTACFAANILCSTQETVEEGKPVTLKCVDSVSKRSNTIFNWYKDRLTNQVNENRIAFYDNYDGVQNSLGGFANRATIDGTTGALTILNTKVSDEHIYSCFLENTETGDIKNETQQLTISVTPSQKDLKITNSPTGPAEVGVNVSFKCSASRVKPPPRQMYLQFADDADRYNGTHIEDKNGDNLTSSVSVEYTMEINRNDSGRKLICHYVTETGIDIRSEEATVRVLYTPTGQPKIIKGDRNTVKVNSTVSLTCDTEQIDGIITWYKWQFVNGTDLGNTTEETWTYRTRRNAETLQFVCIAGNVKGQSNTSAPIDIDIINNGQLVNFMILVLGTQIALSVVLHLLVTIYYCIGRNSTDGAGFVTRDQGSSIVDATTYVEVGMIIERKRMDSNAKQNLTGATKNHNVYMNGSNDDVAHQEDMGDTIC